MTQTVKNELYIDGAWVDVSSRTRGTDKVKITRGFLNEQGNSIRPAICNFTLNNRDGLFSNRNPSSQYFGLLGRNVPFRSGIVESETALRAYAYGREPDYVETADKAVLDITGDIDIRIEIEPHEWYAGGQAGIVLAAKYDNATTNRSWFWAVQPDGKIRFFWSADGNNPVTNGTVVTSTVAADFTVGRIALRVTLDVNNGSGGHTLNFYTSDSITGTWTQLGATVVDSSGTTSIFNSAAGVQVGACVNGNGALPFSNGADNEVLLPLRGKLYAFRLYNGIAGTLVANADVAAQAVDTTSWSDGLGTPNTWTVVANGGGGITNVHRRFYGEVSQFPQKWDTSGTDVYVECMASGIFQRLTQGEKPVDSPIYRNLLQYSPSGYWPLEDSEGATVAGSAVSGAGPATISGVEFGTDEDLRGTAGCITLTASTARVRGNAKATTDTGTANFIFYVKTDVTPPTTTLATVYGTGSVLRWLIGATATELTIKAYDRDNVEVVNDGAVWGGFIDPTQWFGMNLELVQDGVFLNFALNVHQVGSDTFYTFGSGSLSGNAGRLSGFEITGTDKAGYKFAHAFINQTPATFVTSDFAFSSNGHNGETAGARFLRLCEENGVAGYLEGDATRTELMGYQTLSPLTTLLQECADIDGALLVEPRAALGIQLWPRHTLQNRGCLELDYAANQLYDELLPTDDDQILRNDITIRRPEGASARAVQETGPNNINDPVDDPQGVGTYATSYQLNAYLDTRLSDLAQYARHLGTWDSLRYPVVSVHMNRDDITMDADLVENIKWLDIGSPLAIVNLPAWLPPDDAELLIRGYSETYDKFQWTFKWNTQPYGPYRINVLSEGAQSLYRAGSGDKSGSYSTLTSSLNSSATSFSVTIQTGKTLWGTTTTKPGNFPLDIMVGGERMTVSGISGTSSPQTFTISARSVNGVTKSHSAGTQVQVADIFYAAL